VEEPVVFIGRPPQVLLEHWYCCKVWQDVETSAVFIGQQFRAGQAMNSTPAAIAVHCLPFKLTAYKP